MKNKNLNKTKGFTLIEIMLVVGIITLLSSIAMFSSTEARKKAQDAKMILETKQVENAITMFKDDKGFVPYDISVTDGGGQLYLEGTVQYEANLRPMVPKYFPEIPESPDGESYAYGFSEDYQEAIFLANLGSNRGGMGGGGNSNNSCSFIERYPSSWNSTVYIVPDSEKYDGCNSEYFYCPYFNNRESGIEYLKNLCLEYYTGDMKNPGDYPITEFDLYPGSSKNERCGNYSEDKFSLNYETGDHYLVLGISAGSSKPTIVCTDTEFCACVE